MGVLRLILSLTVVAAHYGRLLGLFSFCGGFTAVQSFFIISGFYMSLIINEKYIGKNKSYKLFLTNRLLRIFPIYWIVLILSILVFLSISLLTNDFVKFVNYKYTNFCSLTFLIFTNLFIFFQDAVMFLGINKIDGNLFFTKDFTSTKPALYLFLFIPQAWSLGVELLFYVIAPFILNRGFKIVLPLIIVSILLRYILYYGFNLQNDPWLYRFFPTELSFFLLGYISFRLVSRIHLINNKTQITILSLLAFLTIVFPLIPAVKLSFIPFQLKEIFYFSLITISIPILFNKLKKNRIDNKIGELSFPVYISHMLIGAVSNSLPLSYFHNSTLIAFLSILFSLILIQYVSVPLEKYRQSRLILS